MSILVLLPNIVVDRSGSEDTTSPFKLHVIWIGSSPIETTHTSCAKEFSFTGLTPKVKGTITGGTKKE